MSVFTGNPESGFGGTYADGALFWASVEGGGGGLGGSDASSDFGDIFPPWSATINPLIAVSHMGTLGGEANTLQLLLKGSSTTDKFSQAGFAGLCFDTSTIPSDATIDSVTLRIHGERKGDNLSMGTGANIVVTGFAPADAGTFVAGDFTRCGTINYGSLAYSSFNVSGNNTITLDGAAVTKAGVTKLALMFADCFSGTFTGAHGNVVTYLNFYSTEQSGADNKPLLTVNYTEASAVTTSMVAAIPGLTRGVY